MARFDRINNQAPAQTQLEKDSSPVGRSAHDFSYIHSGNALIGALIPVDCFDVVPSEDLEINIASLLEFRNPTTRQLLNSCRVYFHAYYNRLDDLWEGAKNWIDKGRSGKISLSRPNLIYHVSDTIVGTGTVEVNACTPMSLLNYLGLPAEALQQNIKTGSGEEVYRIPLRQFQPAKKITNSSTEVSASYKSLQNSVDYFPADCAMAYQRNWRDYYSNKNLLQNNKFWFPDNEDHFILSYSCEDAVAINYEDESFNGNKVKQLQNLYGDEYLTYADNTTTPECNNPFSVPTTFDSFNYPNLSGLKFRQFRGDRFTTALPFPDLIRGDIPLLELNSSSLSDVVLKNGDDEYLFSDYNIPEGTSNLPLEMNIDDTSDPYRFGITLGEGADDKAFALKAKSNIQSSITMSDIYTLETLTAFKRRMAMTNGDYNSMIEAQFGVNPRVHDRHATYIGGYYQDFAFNSVTQTSESSATPLGTKAGQGVSSGSGDIGHFHVPDYGWIQIYMSIVPDVMYTQGKPRMFSKRSNLEMYFPLFNNLPAQAIRNDELFISGDPSTDSSPFAYEDRYAEYKSRTNRVSGFMGLSHSDAAFDSAKVMARRFQNAPALNSRFVTMTPENIDMEVFTVVDEPPIDFSCGISVRRVFPGPYTAIEGSLSSPSLMR